MNTLRDAQAQEKPMTMPPFYRLAYVPGIDLSGRASRVS
jgi:hypothetical protein